MTATGGVASDCTLALCAGAVRAASLDDSSGPIPMATAHRRRLAPSSYVPTRVIEPAPPFRITTGSRREEAARPPSVSAHRGAHGAAQVVTSLHALTSRAGGFPWPGAPETGRSFAQPNALAREPARFHRRQPQWQMGRR